METWPRSTADVDLIEAVARGRVSALRVIWDRYSVAVHWVCAVHETDAAVAHADLEATFFALWTNPLSALRARSLPEHLTAIARRRRDPTGSVSESSAVRATRSRISGLTDVQLTSVALLFSGEYSADDAIGVAKCSQAELAHSLRTVLANDVKQRRRGRQLSR
jgi:hypothetical protein